MIEIDHDYLLKERKERVRIYLKELVKIYNCPKEPKQEFGLEGKLKQTGGKNEMLSC